jgi:hypothetical protein
MVASLRVSTSCAFVPVTLPIQWNTHQHINFKIELSGFAINSQHPFLGATPDGIISCDCCGKGALEINTDTWLETSAVEFVYNICVYV